MLTQELFQIMWARKATTSKSFFEDLQAIKNNRLGPAQEAIPEYYPQISRQLAPLPSQATEFGLSTRRPAQVAFSSQPEPSAMDLLTRRFDEMQAHLMEIVDQRCTPRDYQPPQRRMNNQEIECWNCGERGYAS